MKCPICQTEINEDKAHWFGSPEHTICPIRAFATSDDVDTFMAMNGISGIHKAAVVNDERPTIINTTLAILLGCVGEELIEYGAPDG